MRHLDPREHMIFSLAFGQDVPRDEIAAAVGISESRMYQMIRSAKAKLG